METWNRLIAVGWEKGSGEWWKEGEGISQRACTSDSRAWTMEKGLTVERGVSWVEGNKREKIGTIVIE